MNWFYASIGAPLLPITDLHISVLIRGANRLETTGTTPGRGPRTPLIPHHLLMLRNQLNLQTLYHRHLWLAILLAFHGLLRLEDYTAHTPLSAYLTISHCSFIPHLAALRLNIPHGKTDQQSVGTSIYIGASNNHLLCPVRAFLTSRANEPQLSPLIPNNNNTHCLLRAEFDRDFRQLLSKAGLSHQKFSSHSLRRGGATARYLDNHPPEAIRRQGRWSHQGTTWAAYIQPSNEDYEIWSKYPLHIWCLGGSALI